MKSEDEQVQDASIRSLYRFKKLSEELVESLVYVSGMSHDARKIDLLIKHDLVKGIQHFEECLNGRNTKAAISCARRIPDSLRDKYYKRMLSFLGDDNCDDKDKVIYFLKDCNKFKAKDIIKYARSSNVEDKLRKTLIWSIAKAKDKNKYKKDFINWMMSDSYWIAHAAIQAVSKDNDKKYLKTFLWMKEKYESDKTMMSNIKIALNGLGYR